MIVTILTAGLAAFSAGRIEAQSGAGKPMWETLMRAPVPADSLPNISVVSIPVPPAPPVPREPGAGHTHPGPVFAYILQGEIENHVDPYGPQLYKPGGFFYEAPLHVHRFLRNLSTTEPARLIVFQEGADKRPTPAAIKTLLEEPLPSTANQEVSLLRLTLPAGAIAGTRTQRGPGFVYILEGKIETAGNTHSAGDLFPAPANGAGLTLKNASGSEPAKLLLYQVNEKGAPGAVP
jgi:quercetin dioxygenase-like cupin family protein